MKIRHIDTRPTEVGQAHEALGLPPVEQVIDRAQAHPLATVASWFMGFTLFGLAAILLARGLPLGDPSAALDIVIGVVTSDEFLKAAAVGFIAQSIDGALGMAYGISATTFLLGTGASPAVASASVHIAEIFTTGLSGLSHLRLGNVDRKLMLKLLIPGVIGGVLGALVVTKFDGAALKPWISGYLLVMGIYVLAKAWRHRRKPAQEPKHVAKLALFGGFVDAAGGGGWGPVVTTSLGRRRPGPAPHHRFGELRRILHRHRQRRCLRHLHRRRPVGHRGRSGRRRHVRRTAGRLPVPRAAGACAAGAGGHADQRPQRLQPDEGAGLSAAGGVSGDRYTWRLISGP